MTRPFVRRLAATAAGIALSVCGTVATAMPMVFTGSDGQNVTVLSDAAFAAWSASVGGMFTLDNLDGIEGAGNDAFTRTSNLGNVFRRPDDNPLSTLNLNTNVLQGISLRVTQGPDPLTSFVWDLALPADAFGFYTRANNGGTITIAFDDGTSQSFDTRPTALANDNLFWGVSGLAGSVVSVMLTSDDGDSGNSFWDRFVYRPAAQVPEPPLAALMVLGLLGAAVRGRRAR